MPTIDIVNVHAGQVKCLMQQLFDGMAYLHENWVLHRDLKTSNILFNNRGRAQGGSAAHLHERAGTFLSQGCRLDCMWQRV